MGNFGFQSEGGEAGHFRKLMHQVGIQVRVDNVADWDWLLTVQDNVLVLTEKNQPGSKPLFVDLVSIRRKYNSLPISKRGPLSRALGRKTRTVVDATAGWGRDTALLWLMGYEVTAVERSPVMAALLIDGIRRLHGYDSGLEPPKVINDDAIRYLGSHTVDCVYLDPMFPPKRKASALARRPLRLLRDLVGEDDDRDQLYEAAWRSARKRVVIKRPAHAKPWGAPDQVFKGKIMCYDLYLKAR